MAHTDTLDYAWSMLSTYTEGTGVHHGYATAPAHARSKWAVDIAAHGEVSNAWYAKLDPGGFIVPHVDQGPWRERWHYPTSGNGYVWQYEDVAKVGSVGLIRRLSEPYRMNHHKPHAVWNPHNEPRIILIVEYDNPVDQPTTDLILCPMIPEVQEMIDAL